MRGIVIGVIPADGQVITVANPVTGRIDGVGHVLPRYPAGPVISCVFDYIGYEAFTLGANREFARGLPADVSPGIRKNIV